MPKKTVAHKIRIIEKTGMTEPPSSSLDALTISNSNNDGDIQYVQYRDEKHLEKIMKLVEKDLSEPYSIFTYRYFLHQWPELCILAFRNYDESNEEQSELVGCIVGKIDYDDNTQLSTPEPSVKSGYIGMLAVDSNQRKKGIGTTLACQVLDQMRKQGCTSVMLETEAVNKGAMRLYERLGFIREELLVKYYLNWGDAYRLRMWYTEPVII